MYTKDDVYEAHCESLLFQIIKNKSKFNSYKTDILNFLRFIYSGFKIDQIFSEIIKIKSKNMKQGAR